MAQWVKNLPAMQETQETWVRSLSQEDPLEKGMVTHSSVLAWRVSWTEEPGELQSIGSQRIRHDWTHIYLINTYVFSSFLSLIIYISIALVANFEINLWLQSVQLGLLPTSTRDGYCECYTELEWKSKVKSLSHVWLFATPRTVGHQAPQCMQFSRQEYWSGLPFPSPGDLPNSGIKPGSPALQADAFCLLNHQWRSWNGHVSFWDFVPLFSGRSKGASFVQRIVALC